MNPNFDILGLEFGATKEAIDVAYRRLEVVFDRNDELDSPEFADIDQAYKELPESGEEIDRKVWEWATWKDAEGEWNTLVRKAHKAARKAEATKNWSKSGGGSGSGSGKAKTAGRDRGKRSGGYNDD